MPRAAHGVQYRQGPHQDHHRLGGEVLQVNYSSVSTLSFMYKGGAGLILCRLEFRQVTKLLLITIVMLRKICEIILCKLHLCKIRKKNAAREIAHLLYLH
jgi:hypothetical protein